MDTFVTTVDGVTVFRPTGRLDARATPDFENAVKDALDWGGPVLFDLSRVTYAASGALRVVLAAAKKRDAAGRRMAVCGLRPAVNDVFHMAGFTSILEIFDDRDAAFAALAARR